MTDDKSGDIPEQPPIEPSFTVAQEFSATPIPEESSPVDTPVQEHLHSPGSLYAEADALKLEINRATNTLFNRPLTHLEFYYLLSCFPYLKICNAADPYLDPTVVPKVYSAATGWTIVDWGSVLSCGTSRILAENDFHHKGTIMAQALQVVMEIMDIAKKRWPDGVAVVSGFYPMQRMAKIIGDYTHYNPINGFELSDEDQVVKYWVIQLLDKLLYPPDKPIVGTQR
jgi:hypothetical protein